MQHKHIDFKANGLESSDAALDSSNIKLAYLFLHLSPTSMQAFPMYTLQANFDKLLVVTTGGTCHSMTSVIIVLLTQFEDESAHR